MIRRPPRSTQSRSSAASDVYKRQPPCGQRRAGTQAQRLSARSTTQARLKARYPVKVGCQFALEFCAVVAQFDPGIKSFQELHAEEVFKTAYLMTDCTLCHTQFVGRARKRAVAGGRVERNERAEGWQASGHRAGPQSA